MANNQTEVRSRADDCFNKKLTVYGFVMTIFIVLSHWTHFYHQLNPSSDSRFLEILDNLYGTLGILSIATFFMLAGFTLYRGVTGYGDLGGKLLRRLVSLGIPFLVWNVLYLIYYIAYGIYKGNLSIGIKQILLGFTLDPFNSPLWYVFALLLLACLSFAVILLNRSRVASLAVLVAVFVGSLLLTTFVKGESFYLAWILRLVSYLPVYFLGAHLGMHASSTVESEEYHTRPLSVVSAVLSLAILAYFVLLRLDIAPVNLVLYQCLPVLCWAALPAKRLTRVKLSFPLTVSYFVYALHSLLITVLNWVVVRKLLAGAQLPMVVDVIIHLLLVAVLYFVCLLVAFVAKKLLPQKIYRIFAGGSAGRKLI